MLYSFAVTVPASTAAESPLDTTIDLVPGTIEQIGVEFPPGCAGLVHVQLLRSLHQLVPANAGASLASDSREIVWREDYAMYDEPLSLTVRTWSDDDTYDHTVTVRVDVLATARRPLAGDTQSLISRLLGSLLGGGE